MEVTSSIRLVGAHEIRTILGGISRQRLYQLTSRADFPAPVADLAQGKVWSLEHVNAWIARWRPAQSCISGVPGPGGAGRIDDARQGGRVGARLMRADDAERLR